MENAYPQPPPEIELDQLTIQGKQFSLLKDCNRLLKQLNKLEDDIGNDVNIKVRELKVVKEVSIVS